MSADHDFISYNTNPHKTTHMHVHLYLSTYLRFTMHFGRIYWFTDLLVHCSLSLLCYMYRVVIRCLKTMTFSVPHKYSGCCSDNSLSLDASDLKKTPDDLTSNGCTILHHLTVLLSRRALAFLFFSSVINNLNREKDVQYACLDEG